MDLSGKEVAEFIDRKTKSTVEELKRNGITPKLSIIRVGQREDDISYEKGIKKKFNKLDIDYEVTELPNDIEHKNFIDCIIEKNMDTNVHGILIFRPLPPQIDEEEVRGIIAPNKDIDCMSTLNMSGIFEGRILFAPCTAQAVMEILKFYKIPLKGINAIVIGRSLVIGKPIAMMLLGENATVTICHSKTKNIKEISKKGEIIIVAIGKSKYLTKEFVNKESIIIDVGINADSEGNLLGDADYQDIKDIVKMITPVPGGVGSVTTSVLAKQVVTAAQKSLLHHNVGCISPFLQLKQPKKLT